MHFRSIHIHPEQTWVLVPLASMLHHREGSPTSQTYPNRCTWDGALSIIPTNLQQHIHTLERFHNKVITQCTPCILCVEFFRMDFVMTIHNLMSHIMAVSPIVFLKCSCAFQINWLSPSTKSTTYFQPDNKLMPFFWCMDR